MSETTSEKLKRAARAVTVRMVNPDEAGTTLSVGEATYTVDEAGVIEVSPEHVEGARIAGFQVEA